MSLEIRFPTVVLVVGTVVVVVGGLVVVVGGLVVVVGGLVVVVVGGPLGPRSRRPPVAINVYPPLLSGRAPRKGRASVESAPEP